MIHKIRNSPHHIKRRWLWGLTFIAMIIIVGIWLINLQTFLRIPPPATSASVQSSISQ